MAKFLLLLLSFSGGVAPLNVRSRSSRRVAIERSLSFFATPFLPVKPAGAESFLSNKEGVVDTDAPLSKMVRGSVIRGAQVADALDEKWERFSDALRDKKACDEQTGRRMYDNGFRPDGSRLGNPVIGALCKPQALKPLSQELAKMLLSTADAAAASTFADGAALEKTVAGVDDLVRPSFNRANKDPQNVPAEDRARQALNFETYGHFRAFRGELTGATDPRKAAADFDDSWGGLLLSKLSLVEGGSGAPRTGDRGDFSSPFPVAVPDADLTYDYDRLKDALGSLCVALGKLEQGGVIGHWEISIPTDDDGSVVTIAIDDDVTLGAQVLLREETTGKALFLVDGSAVQSMIRSALKNAQLNFRLDSYFLDPSTTKQSIYNPTQLLVSVSNLSGKGTAATK
jgi:hypothetical protein